MAKRTALINSGAEYLKRSGVMNFSGESETCLTYVLDCPRIALYLDNLEVNLDKERHFWQLLDLRSTGRPLQYLLGTTEFMGWEFKVAEGVFIPRPETELLVEAVLNLPPSTFHLPPKILDIGTGCGNIAVSLAKLLPQAHVFACDISAPALQLAKENARLNAARVSLVKSDLFCAFKRQEQFSLIASNPPYINWQQIPELPRELHYEPTLAYDGGVDGLAYYRAIIKAAPDYLQENGFLILEVGDQQAKAVEKIFVQDENFTAAEVTKDYNDIERVIVVQKRN